VDDLIQDASGCRFGSRIETVYEVRWSHDREASPETAVSHYDVFDTTMGLYLTNGIRAGVLNRELLGKRVMRVLRCIRFDGKTWL